MRLVGEAVNLPELPIFISENGYADNTVADSAGLVKDIDRIMYYRAYLTQLARARSEGMPLIGYFPWSLLDNFEWNDGFGTRFGLIHVDNPTQKRTPNFSYHWYQEVIRTGSIV